MFVDFAIVLPIIAGGMLGFRDGSVRKIVAIVVTFGAMFVAKFLMNDLGSVLTEYLDTDPEWAPLHAYLIVFFCIVLLQSLLYRFLTDKYKIGGLADRIVGSFLGAVHVALVVSVVLTIFAIKDIPSERTLKESRSYDLVKNVSTDLLNIVVETVPQAQDTIEKLKEQGVGTITTDTLSAGEKIRDLIKEQAEEAGKVLQKPGDTLSKPKK